MNLRSGIGWLALLLLLWSSPLGEPGALQVDELTLSQMRYRKGLELIRMLYEKILSLDHHFSAMRTDQLVQTLSNPLSYKLFRDSNLAKQSFPAFSLENPYLATGYYLHEILASPAATDEEKAEKDKVLCSLDFALRIQADLHLIYYETAYLVQANAQIKQECRELFEEYTRVIGYTQSLEQCRNADDWETVFLTLETHIQSMRRRMKENTPASQQQLLRDHINLEFSVDRLLNFIRHYQVHIQQGSQYYQKFQLILDYHSPHASCLECIPEAWRILKTETAQSVESFHQAYEVPEFKGSRLKDLLYGFSD